MFVKLKGARTPARSIQHNNLQYYTFVQKRDISLRLREGIQDVKLVEAGNPRLLQIRALLHRVLVSLRVAGASGAENHRQQGGLVARLLRLPERAALHETGCCAPIWSHNFFFSPYNTTINSKLKYWGSIWG